MADGEDLDDDQKTEDATEQRLQQLRDDGRVPKSADIAVAAGLLAGMLGVGMLGTHTMRTVEVFTRRALSLRDAGRPMLLVAEVGKAFALTALPFAATVAVVGIVAAVAQTRGLVNFGELAPKWERLDPINGISRLLPGRDVFLELGKTLLKVGAIGYVVWRVLEPELPRLVLLARMPPVAAARETGSVITRVVIQATVALSAIAALDWFLSWRKFQRDARMTKQEIKDEQKQQDGDPMVKAKRRARARQIARQRTIAEVKTATVLVTNPTHIAIALRYDPDKDAAPMMVAKGVDELALRMREEGRKHGIPIVENRPLARAMHATGKLGRPIPVELYEAVATVIAHVMRIRGMIE